jgi:hypothetical protein
MEQIRLPTIKASDELRGFAPASRHKRAPKEFTAWVDSIDEQGPVLLYTQCPPRLLAALRPLCRRLRMTSAPRVNGTMNTSAVFGVLPRSPSRATCRTCRYSRTTAEFKSEWPALAAANEWVASLYQEHFPAHYKAALADVQANVHKDWRWNDTPYLSVSVNVNQAIKYHRDSGNMPSALSTVLICREGVHGGELALPELGLELPQEDGALLLFRGDLIVHGVHPFRKLRADGFRASIVFYTMKGMATCLSQAAEIAYANTYETKQSVQRHTKEARASLINKCGFLSTEKRAELLAKFCK